jgi:hypothetical protein
MRPPSISEGGGVVYRLDYGARERNDLIFLFPGTGFFCRGSG